MRTLSISATIVTFYFSSIVSGKLCTTKTYTLLDTVSNDHIICPQLGHPEHWTECCGTESSRRCCPGDNRLFDAERKLRSQRDYFGDDDDLDLDDLFDEDFSESRIEGGRHLLSAEQQLPTPQARIGTSSSIGKFVGIIISVVVFIFIVTLVCCCCIPCCFCAKKRSLRSAGVVHSQAAGSGVQDNYSSPGQYPTQQHGPGQYPLQHQAPPPAQSQPYSDLPPPYPGLPAQGYPQQMQGNSGYTPQMTENPGYPPQMTGNPGYPPVMTGNPGYPPQMTGGYPQSNEKQPAFNPNMQ